MKVKTKRFPIVTIINVAYGIRTYNPEKNNCTIFTCSTKLATHATDGQLIIIAVNTSIVL